MAGDELILPCINLVGGLVKDQQCGPMIAASQLVLLLHDLFNEERGGELVSVALLQCFQKLLLNEHTR